jgi:hypothetical protein
MRVLEEHGVRSCCVLSLTNFWSILLELRNDAEHEHILRALRECR